LDGPQSPVRLSGKKSASVSAKKAAKLLAPVKPTPVKRSGNKRDAASALLGESPAQAGSASPTASPGAPLLMSAAKRKKALASKSFLLSADRGAVVVRDRVVRIADCPSLDAVSIYELCRRWMQDDAHARPDSVAVSDAAVGGGAGGVAGGAPGAAGRDSSSSRSAPRVISPVALLDALQVARARQLERISAARAKRVDLQSVLESATTSDAPTTAAALREFVERSKRERADFQRQLDTQTRLAEALLRSRAVVDDDDD
jgi:hypothetical protein